MSTAWIATRSLCHGNEHPPSTPAPSFARTACGHWACRSPKAQGASASGARRFPISSTRGRRFRSRWPIVYRRHSDQPPKHGSACSWPSTLRGLVIWEPRFKSNELLPRRPFPSATRRSELDDSRIHEFRGRVAALATGTESGRTLARSCPRAQSDHRMRCTQSSSAFLVVRGGVLE